MEKTELESAIAAGIFWGLISVLAALFAIWLFSPLLIPLAFAAQIYAVDHWKHILFLVISTISFLLVAWVLWGSITPLIALSSLGRWFKARLHPEGAKGESRKILLILGIFLLAFFFSFAFASFGMTRDFLLTDAIFLTGWLIASAMCFYFALRRPQRN